MAESPVSRFTYRAFISYSHHDKAWADWLHRSLETWRVPSRLIGTQAAYGAIPRSLQPIFRDREELGSATDLGQEITDALNRSECLIVICSQAAATSRWVNEEVLAYKRMGRGARILCLIVDGEPDTTDLSGRAPEECFCPALRFALDASGELSNRRSEPIAADVRPGHDSKPTAKLRLIAGMLGVSFDALIQREAHRRRRRALVIATAALLGMAIASALAINAVIARNEARRQQAQTEQALNYMLGDLHDKLKGVGRLDLMASVTDKALALFAASKPGSLTDDELTQQSRALVQIGEIRLDEARYEPAMDAFQRAYQRSVELTTRHPDNGRFLFDRAQAEYWIGNVYWQQRKLADANTWLTRYRDSTLALLKIDPNNKVWQIETTYGEHNLAVLGLDRGDLDAAENGFQAELNTQRKLAAARPHDAELGAAIADTISWLGNVAQQRGDLAGAQRLFGEQVHQLAELRRLHPEDFRWLSAWADAQVLLGSSLGITGRRAEGLRALADATGAYQTLTNHDSDNAQWRIGSANAQVARAAYAFAAGDADQAEESLSAAMDHFLESGELKTSPDDRQVHRVLSRGWLLRARIAQSGGHLSTATDAANRSLAEAREETTQNAIDDGSLADRAEALLVLGMLQQTRSPANPPPAWTEAHDLLAARASGSHYWRLLDPWLRLCQLTGDDAGAHIALNRLNASGYIPLQPWPINPGQPSPTEGEQHVD